MDASAGAVRAVLPGGPAHAALKRELDHFAAFARSLIDRRGRAVPIIFRPWHEYTGDWFWWGSKTCSPAEFVALWRFTVTYLRDDTRAAITMCRTVVELADRHGKVPALTEFGYRDGLSRCRRPDWYTSCFLASLKADPVARRIAYALVWRNGGEDHFWVPYPGHPAVDDFRKFHADPLTLFQDDLPRDIYTGRPASSPTFSGGHEAESR